MKSDQSTRRRGLPLDVRRIAPRAASTHQTGAPSPRRAAPDHAWSTRLAPPRSTRWPAGRRAGRAARRCARARIRPRAARSEVLGEQRRAAHLEAVTHAPDRTDAFGEKPRITGLSVPPLNAASMPRQPPRIRRRPTRRDRRSRRRVPSATARPPRPRRRCPHQRGTAARHERAAAARRHAARPPLTEGCAGDRERRLRKSVGGQHSSRPKTCRRAAARTAPARRDRSVQRRRRRP